MICYGGNHEHCDEGACEVQAIFNENAALRAQLEEAEADKQVLKAITEVCAQCGSPLISWEPFTKTIEYGADDPVPITYQTIIWTCNNACNGTHGEPPFQWFDHADELLSEAAVREHLSEQRERALREALAFYEVERNYFTITGAGAPELNRAPIMQDLGRTARYALAATEEE